LAAPRLDKLDDRWLRSTTDGSTRANEIRPQIEWDADAS